MALWLIRALVARADRLYPLYLVLIQMGLRIGEALGLTWKAVDLHQGTVQISQTRSSVGGKMVTSAPKSAAGRRTLNLPANIVTELRE
jgi:integrase